MTRSTRRSVIKAMALTPALPFAVQARPAGPTRDAIAADLDRYVGFGNKASGGPGDTACGAWIEQQLKQAGAQTERQAFSVPFFSPRRTELVSGAARAAVLPLAIVMPTGGSGLTGKLVRVEPGLVPASGLSGALVMVELPYARWSSALARPVAETVRAVAAAGAAAVLLVTNGPTGEAIALNADGNKAMVDVPAAILAPRAAAPFRALAQAGEAATLFLEGDAGRREAFNIAGRWRRGGAGTLVVSTPRSGWTICAGERGPGLVTWLALARWAGAALPRHDLLFLCNSGHEYENLGSEHALDALAPLPERTALWLHLGANVAARDWHEPGAGRLLPLPSADPQLFLAVGADLLPLAKRVFAGLPGLEMAYPASAGAAGELSTILAAGHRRVAGIFGAHRYHHVEGDDARCVSPDFVAPVIAACKALILGATA